MRFSPAEPAGGRSGVKPWQQQKHRLIIMNVKNRASFLVSLIILFACGFLFSEGIMHHNKAIDNTIREQEKLIDSISNDIKKYSFDPYRYRITRFVAHFDEARQAFAGRDRERLYELCAPLLAEFREENEFFHSFVFTLPDGTVFLRVQQLEHFGDNISELRPAVSAVRRESKQLSGFDVCPHGVMFWVTEPVYHEGEHIGAVEFGIQSEQLKKLLAENLNSDVSILVKAKFWHKAKLVMEGFQEHGEYVLMTGDSLLFEKIAEKLDFSSLEDRDVMIDDRMHRLHSCALLNDFKGEAIGRLLILQDISEQVRQKRAFIFHSLFLTLAVLIVAITILYYSFGLLIGRLEQYARENKKAKEDLQKAHDKLEERVKERTVDLAQSNARLEDEVLIRRRAEIKVDSQRKFLATVIESMTNPFYVINAETFEVIMANKAACDLTGIKSFHGMTCYRLTHFCSEPCSGQEHPCPLTEVKRTREPVRVEHVHYDRMMQKRYVEINSYPIFDKTGKVIQIVEHTVDITERRHAEQEKEKLRAQLFASQKMEAVGILAGGIAHDFNNILTTILGCSQLMVLRMGKNDPMRDMAEEIYDAAERASALTRQLLAFGRKQIMEMKVVSLNVVIENISRMIGRLVGENISIQMNLADSLCRIKADAGQMEQVIMNLVINARDAMPEGGALTIKTGEVKVDSRNAADCPGVEPGSYAVLTVADTGIGMSREIREKIFEPFVTTKEPDQGTGLGLATVYGIVRQHNGYIHVQSAPDMGATFMIFLPCIAKRGEDMTPPAESRAMPPGHETILVVDDDASIRRLIRNTLEPLGYTLLEADCGEEALEILKTAKAEVDLIMADLIMPGIKGQELIGAVKRDQPHIRSILMSGYIDNIVLQNDMVQPGIILLTKPFPPVVLAKKVREVLDEEEGKE
jgi:PAS domain S-box-containing protein